MRKVTIDDIRTGLQWQTTEGAKYELVSPLGVIFDSIAEDIEFSPYVLVMRLDNGRFDRSLWHVNSIANSHNTIIEQDAKLCEK